MTRLLVLTDLRGNRTVASLIKIFSISLKVNYIVLLANTISPTIIADLAKSNLKIIGLAGNLDDPSTIDAFKKHGLFVESRFMDLDGLKAFFTSLAFNESLKKINTSDKAEVLLTYYPGLKYCCCRNGYVETIDYLVDILKPRIVITGKCIEPCYNGYVASPGAAYRGYSLLINNTENIWLKFINLYELLYSKLPV
ncbi:MAG: hypothetical protein QXP72_00770 [Desulfurococcaceae archaeon]|uniref:Phosphoesterase n=1 Tax=Staphylothermus marinus TaxID=2280 RepID=A0A7C4JNJ1_STAMA